MLYILQQGLLSSSEYLQGHRKGSLSLDNGRNTVKLDVTTAIGALITLRKLFPIRLASVSGSLNIEIPCHLHEPIEWLSDNPSVCLLFH